MRSRLTATPAPQPEGAPVDGDQALDALAEWRTIHAPLLRRQAQQLRAVLMAAGARAWQAPSSSPGA
jgi:hypothetical protein